MGILNYRNAGTRDIAEQISSKAARATLPVSLHRIAYLKLVLLNAAEDLNQLASVPGLRLEKLKGDRKGHHSIRINRQFRICFEWTGHHAQKVEIADYH